MDLPNNATFLTIIERLNEDEEITLLLMLIMLSIQGEKKLTI